MISDGVFTNFTNNVLIREELVQPILIVRINSYGEDLTFAWVGKQILKTRWGGEFLEGKGNSSFRQAYVCSVNF